MDCLLTKNDPTHYVSIFPHWLSRSEWDVQSSMKSAIDVVESRLERRVSFLVDLSKSFADFSLVNEDDKSLTQFAEATARAFYLSGASGARYLSQNGSVIIKTGYLEDDADAIWCDNKVTLIEVMKILEQNELYLLTKQSK